MYNSDQSVALQACLDRLGHGDETAKGELIALTDERLRLLARQMLRGSFTRLRRFEQTDDVLIEAQLKLHSSLTATAPRTARDFYGLASLQIRRVLIDLARKYFGPEGPGGRHESPPNGELPSSWLARASSGDGTPLTAAEWEEFHQRVARLPEPLREVFELIYYHGLKQTEVARLLGVSAKTIQRRWYEARAKLCDM